MFDYYVRLIVQILSINHENFGIKFFRLFVCKFVLRIISQLLKKLNYLMLIMEIFIILYLIIYVYSFVNYQSLFVK